MMSNLVSSLVVLALGLTPATASAKPRADPLAASPIIAGSWRSPANGGTHPGRFGALTTDEREMARIAWTYIANNTQASTGLVNAAQAYPSATLWDSASAMAGIVAAADLGLTSRADGLARLDKMTTTLAGLPLVQGKHPNKVFDTRTAAAVNYSNQPGEIGSSAIDIGRLLVWLKIVAQRYPELSQRIATIPAKWHLQEMIRDGYLYGTAIGPDKQVRYLQEGRLGYEEYAAKGFALWGYAAPEAAKPRPYGLVRIYGVALPYDARDPRELGAHNYVVTESYALDGIEFGWDEPGDTTSSAFTHTSGWIANSAQRIYTAQQRRFERTGIYTARTEHQLKGDPYFVYDTIFSDGQPWVTITETGRSVPKFSAVALKGAFGLWALWNTPYTDKLMTYVRNAYDPEKGWYEGLFENGLGPIGEFTANNNGIILESLLYKTQGKLLRSR